MMTLGPNPSNINPQVSPWGYNTSFQPSSSIPLIQEQQESKSIIADEILNMSVDEILLIYKDDTDLLKHILAVKAQADQRKTADEFRQLEEARQKFCYEDGFNIDEYQCANYASDITKHSIHNISSPEYNQNNASPSFSEASFQTSQNYDNQDISANFDLLLSPPPPATMMMDHGMNIFPVTSHHHQEPAPTVPISMDLPLMPHGMTSQNFNYDNATSSSSLSPSFVSAGQFMSPSPNMDHTIPDVFSTVSSSSSSIDSSSLVADLSTMRPVSCSPSMESTSLSPGTHTGDSHPVADAKKKSPCSKHKRRHLSTTSVPGFSSSTHVLRWAATKKKRISRPIINVNQEPQAPLDHKKVMDALRNKLTRTQTSPSSPTSSSPLDTSASSSSPPTKPTSPTSPRSPPVDTQPSTSVLYLDLKSNPSRHRNCRHH
ncbi:hypothetical protein BCR42DRAFT_488677 [Absidia repens]|uniref:Uncharacterized protein n=1 Tax=Absidia repens TaxID=90262 RepID=A0A1X2ISW2_9FUNG|nr:hypothetical protein BCR42DRAFT_488677 [Absidia repens]